MQPEPKKRDENCMHRVKNDENKRKKAKVLFHAYQSIKNSVKSNNHMMWLVCGKREAFQLSSGAFRVKFFIIVLCN